ncbi:oxygenase MpaB family protein [Jatrophihabitans sp. YIM 134969]
MPRDHWRQEIARLDPAVDWHRIYTIVFHHEFPWDLEQSLGLALFRTYAVPSIGSLLDRTGEFERAVQKRYDDTGLILDTVLAHGVDAPEGRAAIRRMNQMHRSYDISPDDMRYVLSTFVTVPIRWLDAVGWRPFDEAEKVATANYYRALGRRMGIPGIPVTWQEFGDLLDSYEAEHFGFDPGGRRVADATLDLMATFAPFHRVPARVNKAFARALLDDPLLDAFDYAHPPTWQRRAATAGLRARGAFLRRRPPRMQPRRFVHSPNFRSYPGGWDIETVGTFPPSCPIVM